MVPVPGDTPVLGSVPLVHLGKGNVAVCRRASLCHAGVQHCWQPCAAMGTRPGRVCGCWHLGPGGEGGAELPSALLGSISAFRTKAGAFPQPKAGAWKAVSCLQGSAGLPQCGFGFSVVTLAAAGGVHGGLCLPPANKGRECLNPFLFLPCSSWLFWRTMQIPLMQHRWQAARQGWRR